MKINFDKYQGLGNDFVLLDQNRDPSLKTPDPVSIIRICNRRYGVGADGILIFSQPSGSVQPTAAPEFRMIYFNGDGSRAETCFNGIRCIACHAFREGLVEVGKPFTILTDAGTIGVRVLKDSNIVEMKLKYPSDLGLMETEYEFNRKRQKLTADRDNFILKGITLSMGNPHFIVLTDKVKQLDDLNNQVSIDGPIVANSAHFPDGTNFELVHIEDKTKMLLAVWERGSGRTLACGSGATAAVLAGVSADHLRAGAPVQVVMAGGILNVTIPEYTGIKQDRLITIAGVAEYVFSGAFETKTLKDKEIEHD